MLLGNARVNQDIADALLAPAARPVRLASRPARPRAGTRTPLLFSKPDEATLMYARPAQFDQLGAGGAAGA
ncbi:MAG: hypothetical protein WKG07_17190 [Hymenobacter sp.]